MIVYIKQLLTQLHHQQTQVSKIRNCVMHISIIAKSLEKLFTIMTLFQYSANTAKFHYKVAHQLMKYLSVTKNRGIAYWREHLLNNIPSHPNDPCVSRSEILHTIPHNASADQPHFFVDANWGGDRSHQRSMTGLMIMLTGGVIVYKTKFQSAVSLSSVEVELSAAAEAGKITLYLRYILQELGFAQHIPMVIYEDNMGALFMATSDQPTKCTRHMDTKLFVHQDWIKEEHISIEALQM